MDLFFSLQPAYLQNAKDAIISTNNKKEIISWNAGAQQMFGYSRVEILGKSLDLVLTLSLLNFLDKADQPVEAQGKDKEGKIFFVELSLTRSQEPDSPLYVDTFILRDITERRENEKRLMKAMKEAHAANQAKSEFLAMISHELRTPLNAIIGFNQALLIGMDGAVSPQQEESLKKIEKSAFHLLNLINNILDLAKIEANKMELEVAYYSLVDIMQACLEEIKPLADQKHLTLQFVPLSSPVLVQVDKMRMRQVFLNLLSNAVKFTEKGCIEVIFIDSSLQIEIQIKDTGRGLTEEEISKIFRPFAQADSSITRKYGGTGLGLIISKQIMEMHGGTIQVVSQKREGSTFILLLPKK